MNVGRIDERGLVRTLIYFAEACVLREWATDLGIDHIHTHYGTNSATAAMLCRVLGGPTYSFTMHGPEEFNAPRATCLREKIHHAKFVVAISEFTRSQLYRWADYHDWDKISVIHVGVSPMFLDHGPTRSQIPRLVNIGRIVEQKGQAILIEAAACLRDRGFDFELVIVGDGPMRAEIERLIDRHGLRAASSNYRVPEQPESSRRAAGCPGVWSCRVLPKGYPASSSRRWPWGVRSSAPISPPTRSSSIPASMGGSCPPVQSGRWSMPWPKSSPPNHWPWKRWGGQVQSGWRSSTMSTPRLPSSSTSSSHEIPPAAGKRRCQAAPRHAEHDDRFLKSDMGGGLPAIGCFAGRSYLP